MAKIKFKVNLENFMNMTIIPCSDVKEEVYEEVLKVLMDWETYSVYAHNLANHIRKILGIEEKGIVQEAKDIIKTAQKEEPKPRVIPAKGKGKYTWYKVAGEPKAKVRKCDEAQCEYYLKYSEEEGRYHHGKYDSNTQVWSYVADTCEYWGG